MGQPKLYQTKTGVVLTLIKGLGQGDGIPRARLTLAQDVVQYPNETLAVCIKRANYFGTPPIEMVSTLEIDVSQVRTLEEELFRIETYLKERFNLGQTRGFVYSLAKRAKRGKKALSFSFEISQDDATRLGFRDQWSERLILIQKVA